VNFTSASVSVCEALKLLGTRLQTPTLIGCILLKNSIHQRNFRLVRAANQ
jgi:hypothetical protein